MLQGILRSLYLKQKKEVCVLYQYFILTHNIKTHSILISSVILDRSQYLIACCTDRLLCSGHSGEGFDPVISANSHIGLCGWYPALSYTATCLSNIHSLNTDVIYRTEISSGITVYKAYIILI